MSEHIVSFDIKRTLGGYLEMMAFMQDLYGRGMLHEQIIRCRDCKYAAVDHSDHEYRDPLLCTLHDTDVKPVNFCSWAREKR